MADGILAGVAFVDIVPNMKKFAARMTRDMGGRRAALTGAGLVAGGFIVAGIASAVKDGIGEAIQEQVATAGLRNALKNASQTVDVGVSVAGVEDVAARLQEVAGIADDAVLRSASWLATFNQLTTDQSTFDRALKSVADLAAAQAIAAGSSIDLKSAQTTLARALQDPERSMSRLQRIGITFTEAQEEAIKKMQQSGDIAGAQAALFDVLEKKVGGSAEAYGKTLPGMADRAEKAFGEMKESISIGLLPALEFMANKLQRVGQFLVEHPGLVKALVVAIGALAAIMIVASIASAVMVIATTPLLVPILAIGAAVIGLGIAFAIAWRKSERFRNIVGAVIDFVKEHWRSLLMLIPGIGPLIGLIIAKFESLRDLVSRALGFVKDRINDVRVALPILKEAAAIAFNFFGDKVRWVWDKVTLVHDALRDLVEFIQSIPGRIADALGSVGGFFKDIAGGVIGAVTGGDGIVSAAISNVRAANPGGLQPQVLDELGIAQAMGLTLTSGYRPGSITSTGNPSLHGVGRAIDVAGTASQMAAFFRAMVGRPGIAELLYSPIGGWYGAGGIVGLTGSVLRDHFDHVHVGVYDKGGWLPEGWSIAGNFTGAPEPVGLVSSNMASLNSADLSTAYRIRGRLDLGDDLEGYVDGIIDSRETYKAGIGRMHR